MSLAFTSSTSHPFELSRTQDYPRSVDLSFCHSRHETYHPRFGSMSLDGAPALILSSAGRYVRLYLSSPSHIFRLNILESRVALRAYRAHCRAFESIFYITDQSHSTQDYWLININSHNLPSRCSVIQTRLFLSHVQYRPD